jgi:hypothetical protein
VPATIPSSALVASRVDALALRGVVAVVPALLFGEHALIDVFLC